MANQLSTTLATGWMAGQQLLGKKMKKLKCMIKEGVRGRNPGAHQIQIWTSLALGQGFQGDGERVVEKDHGWWPAHQLLENEPTQMLGQGVSCPPLWLDKTYFFARISKKNLVWGFSGCDGLSPGIWNVMFLLLQFQILAT